MKFYTDGSYNKKLYPKVYGWAFSVIEDKDEIDYRSGVDDQFIESYQIGGECQAVIEVLKYCQKNQIFEIDLYHDYIGVEKWANGGWATNKPVSRSFKVGYLVELQNLKDVAQALGAVVKINFHHVKGHSGVIGNELADKHASDAVKKHYKNLK